jgi:hypothetical protein
MLQYHFEAPSDISFMFPKFRKSNPEHYESSSS